MESLTADEIRSKIGETLAEAAVALLVEAALVRFADRLKNGRRHPSHRYLRRALGAVLSELAAEGVAFTYAQRRQARAVIDRRVARDKLAAHEQTLARIPSQRSTAEDRSAAVAHSVTS